MPATPEKRIGDVLLQCGLVNKEQLEVADMLSRKERIRIGEALMAMGVLKQDQLSWALGVQFKLSYVDLDTVSIDWNLIRQFSITRLTELRLLPMSNAGGVVYAVVADPTKANLEQIKEELFGDEELVIQLADEEAILSILRTAGRRGTSPTVTGLVNRREDAQQWIEECLEVLGTGQMTDGVIAIQQDLLQPEHFQIVHPKVTGDAPEPLDAELVFSILEVMREQFAEELVISGAWCGWVPAVMDSAGVVLRAPVRGTYLQGCTGQAIILERVHVNPPSLADSKTVLVHSRDPIRVKHAVASAGAVIFESHRDALFTNARMQIAFALPQHRSVMARRVSSAFPGAMMLWESLSSREADLAPAGFIPFLVILHNDPSVTEDVVEVVGSTPASAAERVRAVLRGEAHA